MLGEKGKISEKLGAEGDVLVVGRWDRLKKGFQDITPLQLLEAKLYGSVGAFFGICFAIVMTVVSGVGYFAPWLGFVAFLQVVDVLQTRKQIDQMRAVFEIQKRVDAEQTGGGV